ncbi:NUDIX domain-containing protein [bacterium]|nr:NUDIX domain-containing protein [bacterium]
MSSFLFSADSWKMHPWFDEDGFEFFSTQGLEMLAALAPSGDWFSSELQDLLNNYAATQRTHLPQHITTSSVVLNPEGNAVLLLFHNKICEWVYPGGHADGDWQLLRSSLRECFEETALQPLEVLPPKQLANFSKAVFCPHFFQKFFIKASQKDPAHIHFDAVFVFRALSVENASFDPNESAAMKWISIADLQKHALRGAGILEGIDALTAQLCLRAVQSALGAETAKSTRETASEF